MNISINKKNIYTWNFYLLYKLIIYIYVLCTNRYINIFFIYTVKVIKRNSILTRLFSLYESNSYSISNIRIGSCTFFSQWFLIINNIVFIEYIWVYIYACMYVWIQFPVFYILYMYIYLFENVCVLYINYEGCCTFF